MNRPYTYCALCGNSGTVRIWHPDTIESLRRGDDPVRRKWAVVACKCKDGDRFTHKLIRGESRHFLERFGRRHWHVRVEIRARDLSGTVYQPHRDVSELGSDQLKAFIANRPMNYNDEFDRFNAEGAIES